MATKENATYTHGHHSSVLKSHTWRTAQNSAAFLLPHLKDGLKLLDVGCGPGTITADFAKLVGPSGNVVALEYAAEVLIQAKLFAEERGVENVEFVTGDVHALEFEDETFDVVFAHQVLQHVGDPVQALREMRRVTKRGGIVAARDGDYFTFVQFPEHPLFLKWKSLYIDVAKANGGEANAGRYLHAWAREAGFKNEDVEKSVTSWCYSTKEEVAWWSGLWAERTLKSAFATTALKHGLATQEELQQVADHWTEWGQMEDPLFWVPSGEILCHKTV